MDSVSNWSTIALFITIDKINTVCEIGLYGSLYLFNFISKLVRSINNIYFVYHIYIYILSSLHHYVFMSMNHYYDMSIVGPLNQSTCWCLFRDNIPCNLNLPCNKLMCSTKDKCVTHIYIRIISAIERIISVTCLCVCGDGGGVGRTDELQMYVITKPT